RRGDGDAEILHDLLGRAGGGKLVERNGKTRQRKQKTHVVEIVAGLVVTKAEQARSSKQDGVDDHDEDRNRGDRERAKVIELRQDDVGRADHDNGEEQEAVEEARRQRFDARAIQIHASIKLLAAAWRRQTCPCCPRSTSSRIPCASRYQAEAGHWFAASH